MIECNFIYSNELLNKINKTTTKNINIFSEIAMFLILVGTVVLFVMGQNLLGAIFVVIFVLLLISLIFTNKSFEKANYVLMGQNVNVIFNEESMQMTASLNDKVMYNATFEYSAIKKFAIKNDLIYVYFDKTSIIIIPKLAFKVADDYEKAIQLIGNNYLV